MTQYIILVSAKTMEDLIPVEDELAVAQYWLEVDRSEFDSWRKLAYLVGYKIASDYLLDKATSLIWTAGLKGVVLRSAYQRLKDGYEYSNFCWGNRNFAKNYFE